MAVLSDHMASGHSKAGRECWPHSIGRSIPGLGAICPRRRVSGISASISIVRVEGRTAAMSFEIRGEGDRATIQRLIEYAERKHAAESPVPAA